MDVLALDSALARTSAAVLRDGAVLASRQVDGARGQAALLPALAGAVIEQAGQPAIGLVAVTVGPGGFTGIRAALSLAHGYGLAACCPVIGVTVAEALADSLPALHGRVLWTAISARAGHVHLDAGTGFATVGFASLPKPHGRIAVAGDAAAEVASLLAARDADVMLTDARLPLIRHVAMVALCRAAGTLPPLPAQPLYVEAPRVSGPRPP